MTTQAVEWRLAGILQADWKGAAAKVLTERRRTGSGEVRSADAFLG